MTHRQVSAGVELLGPAAAAAGSFGMLCEAPISARAP